MIKITLAVGVRPNLVKAAALIDAAKLFKDKIQLSLLHTHQHQGIMSDQFFVELGLPAPSGDMIPYYKSSAEDRFGGMISWLSGKYKESNPDFVMVVGDCDSTAAGAIAAAKSRIPIIHVEAGLRCGDMGMQEEINRILVDSVSEILYTTTDAARDRLIAEGHDPDGCRFVGNVMVDTLLRHLREAKAQYPPCAQQYVVLTLHRAENVDDPTKLRGIMDAVDEIGKKFPVVFPVHPRTAVSEVLKHFWFVSKVPPMGYHQFISLLANTKLVLTDSGGVQEETTVLGVPCITLRDSTERPETIFDGTNTLVGTDSSAILRGVGEAMNFSSEYWRGKPKPSRWDGQAAVRIMNDLVRLA